MSFICCEANSTRADSGNTDHLSLLSQLPSSLWTKSPTDVGKSHCILPNIQIDYSKSLPRFNQCPVSKEVLQIMQPTIEDHKLQGLVMPCVCLWSTPILLVRKPKGQRWRLV